ncbi:ubiquinol-cytochrome c reductase core subunit 1 [Podochytrium sp. JEL0797]|nr:ubiquinol-cytochrome c reductase core subunit 1 [Podochytrium sp. JEL0797]
MQKVIRRTFAVATSPVVTHRRGDQILSGLAAVKSVSVVNGVRVATLDGRGPVSSLAVVVGAGSRHEKVPGVAHLLKATLVRARPSDNVVRTIRSFEQRGNTLYASVGNETTLLGSSFLRDDLVDVVPALLHDVFNPSFHPHELLDALPTVQAEANASLADPKVAVHDALNKAAFRRGLGASLFATDDALHHLTRKDLQDFAQSYFTQSNVAIVGSGIAHEELEALVKQEFESLTIPDHPAVRAPASQYYGGEIRIAASGPTSHLAIAFKSAAFTDAKAFATAQVLRALLDGSNRVEWGNPSGYLAKAASSSASVNAFAHGFTDAGLLGVSIHGSAASIQGVAKKSIEAIKFAAGSSIAEADLTRAKKIAIVERESAMNLDETVFEMGRRVVSTGQFLTSAEFAAEIANVSAQDVSVAAQALLGSTASVVARGDLSKLPYADEL